MKEMTMNFERSSHQSSRADLIRSGCAGERRLRIYFAGPMALLPPKPSRVWPSWSHQQSIRQPAALRTKPWSAASSITLKLPVQVTTNGDSVFHQRKSLRKSPKASNWFMLHTHQYHLRMAASQTATPWFVMGFFFSGTVSHRQRSSTFPASARYPNRHHPSRWCNRQYQSRAPFRAQQTRRSSWPRCSSWDRRHKSNYRSEFHPSAALRQLDQF